jgi:putative heme-binding domain-containing protein
VCFFGVVMASRGQNAVRPASPVIPAAPAGALEDYRKNAMIKAGDRVRGKALFENEPKLACARCHTVDGKAGRAGPDLFAVGDKLGRREIIESILAPSATIAEGYSTTILITKSGGEYTGVVKQVTEAWIELVGADAQAVRIPTAEIKERRTSSVSLMPEGLQAGLTPEEFTDVIDYLVSLKQPQSAEMTRHGMPEEISTVKKPIALIPFHSDEFKFEHPVWFGQWRGASNVFLVAEHETGKIWRLEKGGHGDSKTLFADFGAFSVGTRGLIGIALHPRFVQNHKYYIARHVVEDGHFATLIFEAEARADLKADSGRPPRLLLRIDAATNVHYGGGLQFGPDGYFYIGMGDTGPQEDPQGNAQNLELLRGKMLRIDVDRHEEGRPYAIPADNPRIPGARPEIWAMGFRVPWRFSFDPVTRELWVGDVGQDRYEEVDIVRRGENMGWNVHEGFERFSNRYRKDGVAYVPPIFAYARKYGPSVTGGFVYRADRKSPFYGVYIFGDYESRRIWGLTQENRVLKEIREIGTAPQKIVSFGRDDRGFLYLVGYEGTIYRMDFSQAGFP